MNLEKTPMLLLSEGSEERSEGSPKAPQKPKRADETALSEADQKRLRKLRKMRRNTTGRERRLLTRNIYYILNRSQVLSWGDRNRERVRKNGARWYRNNRLRHRETTYRNRRKDMGKHRASVRSWHHKHAQHRLNYRKRKRETDPKFLIADRVRRRMNKELRHHGARKGGRTFDLIGCTPTELRVHIESLFLPGMSWTNRSLFHVDHIRPLASFDLTDPAQQRAAFHFTNLQPLWAGDNIRKGARVPVQ